jgi:hypothetical protein
VLHRRAPAERIEILNAGDDDAEKDGTACAKNAQLIHDVNYAPVD